jgi:lipopolysaccharide export LptBFGC system permease protein LptF
MNDAAQSGEAVGQMISTAITPLLVVLLGFVVGRFLSRRRTDGKKVQWPLYVGLVLALLMIVGAVQGQ